MQSIWILHWEKKNTGKVKKYKMKLLSIAVPCYNSEGYMRNCIESLLPGGEEVEIIIVDDGSTKDRTAEMQMNMLPNIQPLSKQYIRKTAVTDRQSTPV